jgi:hypothetical protein
MGGNKTNQNQVETPSNFVEWGILFNLLLKETGCTESSNYRLTLSDDEQTVQLL